MDWVEIMRNNNIKLNIKEKNIIYSAIIRIIFEINNKFNLPIVFHKSSGLLPIMPGTIHEVSEVERMNLSHCQLKMRFSARSNSFTADGFNVAMVGIMTGEFNGRINDDLLIDLFWSVLHEFCHILTIPEYKRKFSQEEAEADCAIAMTNFLYEFINNKKLANKIARYQIKNMMDSALGHYKNHIEILAEAFKK